MATVPTSCSSCGQPLPSGRLDGFCPACLWRGLFVDALANTIEGEAAAFASLQLPGLTVVREIARGGMGIVYRARQQSPERDVALKMLLPHQVASPAAKERFRAEARAIAALDHPGILPVHQLGELDGLPWFTMKLAAGGSLAQRKDQFNGQWRAIAELIVQLADAIHFAHERGILHRDLKPGNILFDETGKAYVSDFGLAKFLDADATLTTSRAVLGTPGYLAPELLEHTSASATTAADLYGLGALLYELLYGRPPFEAPSLAALLKQISESAPPFTNAAGQRAPRDLEIICRKCLEKEPTHRYALARELAADLQRWLEGRPILARPAPLAEVFAAWVRRNPVVAALAGLLFLALLGSSAALWRQNLQLADSLRRTETSQRAERDSLRAALLAQARALGQTTQPGRRAEVLAILKQAATLPAPVGATNALAELRGEAIAALSTPDLVPERRWLLPLSLTDDYYFTLFAPSLEHYALAHAGAVDLRATADQALLAQLPGEVPGGLNNLVFDSAGRWLAALHASGEASVWDWAITNRIVTFSAADGVVTGVDFHPSKKSFAVVRRGGGVELRGLLGKLLEAWPATNSLAARFSADGGHIAIVTENAVEVWTLNPRERLWTAPLVLPVHRVEWNAAGTALLVASRYQNALYVLDAANGLVLAHHATHSLDPARFAFHPGGELVASVGREGTLRLWDVRTGRDLVVLPARVETLRWSPDGRQLAYSPSLIELGTLSLAAPDCFAVFADTARTSNAPHDFLVTPDGRELITVSSVGLRRWDAVTGNQIELIRLPGEARTWGELSPTGAELIYGRRGGAAFRRNRTNETATPQSLPIAAAGWVLDVNAASDWLVATGSNSLALWPGGDAAKARTIGGGFGGMRHTLSPEGRWIAIAHRLAGAIRIVDVTRGEVVQELAGGSLALRGNVPRAWFTPDGARLITSNRRHFQLWETGSWKELRRWPVAAEAEQPGSAAITVDGQLAALEIAQDVFQLINLASGERLANLRPPTSLGAAAAVFTPDSTTLCIAGAGPKIYRWNLAALRRELSGVGLNW